MKDGYLGKCKTCAKTDVKLHRSENEHVREYDRVRGNRQSKESVTDYRNRYPLKYKAHTHINNLVRKGLLTKPEKCESCYEKPLSSKGLHGHHDDYKFKDVVRWLCAKCHHRWHALNGEGLNPI